MAIALVQVCDRFVDQLWQVISIYKADLRGKDNLIVAAIASFTWMGTLNNSSNFSPSLQ